MQKIVDRKPVVKSGEVFATDRGWEVKHESGSVELLISAKGLKSFIDSQTEVVESAVQEVVQEEVKPKRGRKPVAEE